MNKLTLLASAIALTTATAMAQSVLVPSAALGPFAGTSGNYFTAGGINRFQMVYDTANFTSQGVIAPVSITSVQFLYGGGTTATNIVTFPSVSVYLQPAAVDFAVQSTTYSANRTIDPLPTANYAGPVTTQAGTYYVDIPLTTPISFDPSAGVDLLIEVEVNGAPSPALGNTQACTYSAAPPANSCNVKRSVGSLTALTGANSAFVPIVNLVYTPAPNAASYASLGAGCIAKYASLYELFAAPANFDLQNSALTFLSASGGYVAVRSGSWIPVGSIQAVPTVLSLGDDATVNYPFTVGSFPGWTGIEVCSNGYVAPAIGNTLTAAPNVNTFLNSPNPAFGCQLDLDPQAPGLGAGTIQVEESAGVTTVTWNGVTNWNSGTGAAPCDIQIQLYPSGDVTLAFGANFTTFNPNGGVLVGYSPGGPSRDPGNRDISALTAGVFLEPADVLPMELAATNRPVFGTNWNLTTSNIDATSVLGVDVFGVTDPGINDLFFLGAPGCGLRASLDVVNAWFVTGPTHSYSFSVPAGQPALQGFNLYTTTATLQVPGQNAFGWMTSNGIQGTLGSI